MGARDKNIQKTRLVIECSLPEQRTVFRSVDADFQVYIRLQIKQESLVTGYETDYISVNHDTVEEQEVTVAVARSMLT